ncbi:hypothetical protein [Pontibacillus yanchengensis]|uniref:Uncharacterized protein n=1 Tax=Pontibacillus yanchengensis Y32 TaxID=1385514 RepID=A0A0A2TDY1_9BACI|nr:hypothetical protein [Pontibacillus yanchengensis]KGP73744.1 hypothetical protein N782_02180 [Pontibacillus yanchengensis Y32]
MWKKMMSFNNPWGWVTAGVLLLTFSDDARKGTRKALVKGVGAAMFVGDQVKGLASGTGKGFTHLLEEAKAEKEQMHLPEGMGESMKMGMYGAADKTKETYERTKERMSNLFEDPAQVGTTQNVMNDEMMKNKMNEIAQEFDLDKN